MNIYFTVAAGLSVLNALAHTFLGGREVARPLVASEGLKPLVKWVAYYCWHDVTLVLWSMAAAFGWLALGNREVGLTVFLLVLTAGFMLWGLALPLMAKQTYKAMPQGFLFVPVFVFALLGLGS